ncbi:YjbF family lipoprotein [Pseudidiomarina sp. 1APP75-27a]|uniref:YjbF family lipoprotein n=1 Tax=Pseudidiomarina terrestris TaxID=2820060 RepID=UPI002B05F1F6|nr:YjbF family lipoprotein [Pseudidiomarina sp. 1APP75-27a]MEA3587723.1 YjbF family lipoprotein [Pseudidiomarina sp. 1APP75-27a]
MMDTAETAFFGHKGVELSVEEVADYPYAAAYVRTDNFPQVVAVLDRVSGEQRVYKTGGNEAIATRFGRVLTSSGIPGMTLFTRNWQADPLNCHVQQLSHKTNEACATDWQREVITGNYGENDIHLDTLNSSFSLGEKRDYTHPDGTELEVTVIHEAGKADEVEFRNEFYAVNGRVVYAHQWVSPAIGYVTWREMKPFDGDLK